MADSPRRFDRKSFLEWKAHPSTGPFLQFLRDQRSRLMDQWASGQEMDPRHQTKALLMGELADLEWPDVASFYDLSAEDSADDQSGPQ